MLSFFLLPFALVLAADLPEPTVGPCTLLNNGLKCTTKGYFETVQCDSHSCFCVMAHNGFVDENTRTPSPHTKPNCTNCYNTLKRIFAYGQPPEVQQVLLCNNKTGEFADQQCDSNNICWCVDPATGIEKAGSRAPLHKYFHCGFETEFSLDSEPEEKEKTPVKAPELPKQQFYPVGRAECKLAHSNGDVCSNDTSTDKGIKFFFDYATFECLAFEYSGCGGNKNRFNSRNECWSACKIPDLSGCSAMLEPVKGATCGMDPVSGKFRDCPSGSTCRMGAFGFGSCCDAKTEALFDKNYSPKCSEGVLVQDLDRLNNWNMTRLGKSCTDNFCPSSSRCIEGEIFAHCCQ